MMAHEALFPALANAHTGSCLVSSHSHNLLGIVTQLLGLLEPNQRKGALPHVVALVSDPSFLFRFYFKCNLNKEETAANLLLHIQWRLSPAEGVKLGSEQISPKAQDYLSLGIFKIHGQDKQGRPTLHINMAKYNAATEKNYINDFKDALVYTLEVGRRCIASVNESLARFHSSSTSRNTAPDWRITPNNVTLIHQLSVIVDLEGVGLANINYEMMPILLSLFANHFPGIFGTLYVLNFGWLHSGIWSIVKRALSAEACKKLLFLTKEEMLEYFDGDLLLSEHGGTCTVSKCSELFVRYGSDESLKNASVHILKTVELVHKNVDIAKVFPHDISPLSLLLSPAPSSTPPSILSLQNKRSLYTRSPLLKPYKSTSGSIPPSPFATGSESFFTPLMHPSPSMEVWFDAPEDITSFLLSPAMTPMQTPSIYPTSASSTAIKEIWSPGMVQTLGLAVVPGLELLDLELPESAMGDGSSTVVEGCEQDDECMRSPRSDVPQTPRSIFLEDSAGNSDGRSVGYPRERVSWTTTGAAAVCGECSCCKNRRDDGSSIAVRIWALGKGVVMSPWNLSLTLAQLMVDASTGELFCRECRRSKTVKKREVASVSKGVKFLATIILASSAIGACWKYARFALSDKDRLTRLGGKFITVLGCIGLEGVAGSVVDLCFGKNRNINNT